MKIPQADVSQGLSTTTFEITSKATIPSDNASHKVDNCLLWDLVNAVHIRCQWVQ